MKRTFVRIIVAAAVVSTGVAPGRAGEIVEIHLRGRYYMEPATVQIMIAVEPDSENRVLRVAADGDEMYRASDLPLNGAKEKRLHFVQFKNLPAGHYTLRAEVFSNEAVRGVATQELLVTGGGV